MTPIFTTISRRRCAFSKDAPVRIPLNRLPVSWSGFVLPSGPHSLIDRGFAIARAAGLEATMLSLPYRAGEKPKITPSAPHRQLDQNPPANVFGLPLS